MENRLKLNKMPVYDLPDEVKINTWLAAMKGRKQPNYKPDLIISMYLTNKEITIEDGGSQIWVKTDNKELLQFLRSYDWCNSTVSIAVLSTWRVKKVILEEFYGVKNAK